MTKQTKVLIADDSMLFRRALIDAFNTFGNFEIIGEATNGIEALDLAVTHKPDLVIMDLEMPMMDGLTALMHLMHFQPIPTVIISSLSAEGSTRSFDALSKGAVDFINKDSFGNYGDGCTIEGEIIERIIRATQVVPHGGDSILANKELIPATPVKQDYIIFCEECGTRNIFTAEQKKLSKELHCSTCGDLLEENLITTYRRLNSIAVLGAGKGSFSNLLTIIANLPDKLNSAIIILIKDKKRHVNTFTEYLAGISQIKVVRATDEQTLEGGTCYVAAASEKFCMKPYSAHFTLTKAKRLPKKSGPFDLFMSSAAPIFKDRLIGMMTSGEKKDGEKGMASIKKNGGEIALLKGENCLYKELGEHIRNTCEIDEDLDEIEAVEFIARLHCSSDAKCSAA